MTVLERTVTQPTIVLVTGPAGAGRATAIKALEDMGFEAIDNLPLSLVPRLLSGPPLERPLALGIDPRNRDFSIDALLETLDLLAMDSTPPTEVLYVDCAVDVLLRRYSETRRRHPLAPDTNPTEGIRKEIDLLRPIRSRADILIDTTKFSVHDLKAEINRWFGGAEDINLAVNLTSFSYKRGLPRGADIVFDCRFLRNPHWVPDLRPLDGRDMPIQDYVCQDDAYQAFFEGVRDLLLHLLPRYRDEGKAHLSVAFGCSGGRHRSVTLVETMAKALADADWQVSIRHREVESRVGDDAAQVAQARHA
ncbi:RNase adapter RapZ [Shimia ponticola]|uniref:RNase adapter RapZ n=1 Tax=Shimia ponticola TaxID=2582893 RepID=UPI0011BF2762|nr:RNase adapter RapZ [Shimia ponticola]